MEKGMQARFEGLAEKINEGVASSEAFRASSQEVYDRVYEEINATGVYLEKIRDVVEKALTSSQAFKACLLRKAV